MKRSTLWLTAALLSLTTASAVLQSTRPALAQRGADRQADPFDRDPDLKTKIVPVVTVGSGLNVGAAQVQGQERDVERVKVVAQLETDYKDRARIKILVPVQSENVVKHIDRVPGVSVSALADYAVDR